VTTRAVSAAAGVQVPVIYRHFGDMRSLLDAAAAHGFASYLQAKKRNLNHGGDPVDDLRHGWNLHVEFALSHAPVYSLLYGDPRPGVEPPGVHEAALVLRGLLERIAAAGRLRVAIEQAHFVVHAACKGTALELMALQPEHRDMRLSAMAREIVLEALTTPERAAAGARAKGGKTVAKRGTPDMTAVHAVALKAVLAESSQLSDSEKALMGDWLTRLATRA
jgi:AcrR family transcriptional regulator